MNKMNRMRTLLTILYILFILSVFRSSPARFRHGGSRLAARTLWTSPSAILPTASHGNKRRGSLMKAGARIAIVFAATAFVAGASAYGAESTSAYPSRPIRLIVPFSPGGSADNLARTMQPALSAALGQSLV